MSNFSKSITDCIRHQKVLIVMMGVSGAGKSTFLKELQTILPEEHKVFSLDQYRLQANGGRYPSSDAEHREINAKIVPLYDRDLINCPTSCIVLDNTHLRWTPNCLTMIKKATEQRYHLLMITPPITSAALSLNRSTHGLSEILFLGMLSSWPGYRFSPFLNTLVPPDLLHTYARPLKNDPFGRIRGHRWQHGTLYLLDTYIGYLDEAMGEAIVAGGHAMRRAGAEDLFLRKDSVFHLTLLHVKKRKTAEDMFNLLLQRESEFELPELAYLGVDYIEEDDTSKTYFLVLEPKVEEAWRTRLKEIDPGAMWMVNGGHVTLGYSTKDLHSSKKVTQCRLPIDLSEGKIPFEFKLKEVSCDVQTGATQSVLGLLRSFYPGVRTLDMPDPLQLNLYTLLTHGNVFAKTNCCSCVVENYHMMTFVVGKSKQCRIDDEVYQKSPELQALVPRGLSYCFELCDTHLRFVGTVYPTSKFFGDFDDQTEVRVMSEDTFRALAPPQSRVVETEKANGEMFTFTVLERKHNAFLLASGSKTVKLLFRLDLDASREDQKSSIQTSITAYLRHRGSLPLQTTLDFDSDLRWTLENVWAEMAEYFLNLLCTIPHAVQLCQNLLEGQSTLSGEFESGRHPHLLPFPYNHQAIQFFALTSPTLTGTPTAWSGAERIAQLNELKTLGLTTVQYREHNREVDLQILRQDVWRSQEREGAVFLILEPQSGQILHLLKVKTAWYVIFRSFREVSRTFVNKEKPLADGTLQKKLESKCSDKFGRKITPGDSTLIRTFIERLQSEKGAGSLKQTFQFNFPSLLKGLRIEV